MNATYSYERMFAMLKKVFLAFVFVGEIPFKWVGLSFGAVFFCCQVLLELSNGKATDGRRVFYGAVISLYKNSDSNFWACGWNPQEWL